MPLVEETASYLGDCELSLNRLIHFFALASVRFRVSPPCANPSYLSHLIEDAYGESPPPPALLDVPIVT